MTDKKTIEEDKIQKIKIIRHQFPKGMSITPPKIHLIDISVVESESFLNVIGYFLTTFSATFLGIYYTSPEKPTLSSIVYFFFLFLFFFGIIVYIVGKIYLFWKIRKEKISFYDYINDG